MPAATFESDCSRFVVADCASSALFMSNDASPLCDAYRAWLKLKRMLLNASTVGISSPVAPFRSWLTLPIAA